MVSTNVGRGNFLRCPAVNVQNRFNALMEDGEVAHTAIWLAALDVDDTDSLASRSSCSAAADNFSGNRRLRLVWDPEQNLSPEVRTAATMIRSLANRVGPIPRGSILPGGIRRQRWSSMYVPLMWAAAGQATTCPLLEWLIVVAPGVSEPVALFGGEMPVSVAARVGWESLRHATRSWTINSEEELSARLGRSGIAATRPGNHNPNRAQHRDGWLPNRRPCCFVGMRFRGVDVGRRTPEAATKQHQQKPPGCQDEGHRGSFRSPKHKLGRDG